MFHQVPPTVNWTTYADPRTMTCVGTDTLAFLCQNIIIFQDVKTNVRTYYKGDHITTCAGISLLTGHNRFPFFVIAEAVLRPTIYVYKYPEMEKLTAIPSQNITAYLDIALSEYGYVAAITASPSYTLRLWNYRTGAHYADVDTNRKCSKHCLNFTTTSQVIILQHSVWHREIYIWELCLTADRYHLHEVRTIQLGKEFEMSKLFMATYWEDGCPYVVNDYGQVSLINQFNLKHEWKVPNDDVKRCAYKLAHNKAGLLVASNSSLYFIKKRQTDWVLDWKIIETGVSIRKVVSDFNANIYVASDFGHIHYVDHVNDTGALRGFTNNNCRVGDYCLLKAVKDEVVLLLIVTGELRLVDIQKMGTISSLQIDDAYSISAHNVLPCVAVGTKKGEVHFVSFEKLRAPVHLGSIKLDDSMISHMGLIDNTTFVKNKINGLYILHSDFKASDFHTRISLEPEEKGQWHILDLFLLDDKRAMVFNTFETDRYTHIATEAWLYYWTFNDFRVRRKEFDLPYKYRNFAVVHTTSPDGVEFMGIRLADYVFDVFFLSPESEFSISYSVRTYNFGHISMICGTRNIITSATQGIACNFRSHKRSKLPYMITRPLLTTYQPQLAKRMDECFNSRYFLLLYTNGFMMSYRLPKLIDSLKENTLDEELNQIIVTPRAEILKDLKKVVIMFMHEWNEHDEQLQKQVKEELKTLETAMAELISYDISVTGQTHGIYRKFCLNTTWLEKLTEEARVLCDKEREWLTSSIEDQTRIRNWILTLIHSSSTFFSRKLRSLFSHIHMENYSMHPALASVVSKFDCFRFYDVDMCDEDAVEAIVEPEIASQKAILDGSEEATKAQATKIQLLRHFIVEKDKNVFEHVMSKDFEMQDVKLVSFNQMYNEDAKLKLVIIDALKEEFNKEFTTSTNYKQEIVDIVLDTNAKLKNIYNNINCMLCLLKMEQFVLPQLSVPQWSRDENLDRIMTVDDSEIVAINRRKRSLAKALKKSGRILLWPLEYWTRAIMTMMDGVLEKLWEEEIKKTPQLPEFIARKQIHEYTLEDQKVLLEFEKKISLLEEDRRKYLRMLRDSEVKTLNQKKFFILKLNERIAETAILKLKYDFAIKHESLRLLNIKVTNFKRIEYKKKINGLRQEMDKFGAYIGKYNKLHEFWERNFADIKSKLDTQTYRDKQLERQFKGQFLNSIPAHLMHELNKIYKRRPKLPAKAFSTAHVCFEVAERIVSKKPQKFPLPQELLEFLNLFDGLDEAQHCPNQLDQKHWENFTKIRRQKLESELRLKGIGYQLLDAQSGMSFFAKELVSLKNIRTETGNIFSETVEEYYDTIQNQNLEIVLTMGQIEVGVTRSLDSFKNCMLMNVNDINEVNELIRQAGRKKLNAMQRVAFFRRQVIYKEWEHKVVRANIEYLEYVLKLVEKCKISYEFLEVLRNWSKLQENKASASRVGTIEAMIQQRTEGGRRQLECLCRDIDQVKVEIQKVRNENNAINKKIEDIKCEVSLLSSNRDVLSEEKLARERSERFAKLKTHRNLIDTVRQDYIHIMELSTILELQRLRTYPTLGPAPQYCEFAD